MDYFTWLMKMIGATGGGGRVSSGADAILLNNNDYILLNNGDKILKN